MLPATVRILVCTTRQDMRRSFDTLGAVVRDVLHEEPQSGALYVFVGKRPTRVQLDAKALAELLAGVAGAASEEKERGSMH